VPLPSCRGKQTADSLYSAGLDQETRAILTIAGHDRAKAGRRTCQHIEVHSLAANRPSKLVGFQTSGLVGRGMTLKLPYNKKAGFNRLF
jgi:hypothetical protein